MAKHTTTPDERAPYISALLHNAGPSAVQELLEAGISNIASGSEDALALAGKVEAAIATDTPPKFDVDDAVVIKEADPDSIWKGKVESRYLNEDGVWEYQVLFTGGDSGRYTEGVREQDLEAA